MPFTVGTTTIAQTSAAGSIVEPGVIAMVALVAFLIARELAGTGSEERAVRWSRGLNVAIAPLLMVCAVIVAEKIAHAF